MQKEKESQITGMVRGILYFSFNLFRSLTNPVVGLISRFFLIGMKEKNWKRIDYFTGFVRESFILVNCSQKYRIIFIFMKVRDDEKITFT